MHSPNRNASTISPPAGKHRVDDVVYQLVTLGAILLVLGSVWIF